MTAFPRPHLHAHQRKINTTNVLLLSNIHEFKAGDIVQFENCNEFSPEDLIFVKNKCGAYRVCYAFDLEQDEDIIAVKRIYRTNYTILD